MLVAVGVAAVELAEQRAGDLVDLRDLLAAQPGSEPFLRPLGQVGPVVDQAVGITSYDQVMATFVDDSGQYGRGEPHAHSGLIDHLDPSFAAEVAGMLDAGATHLLQIRAVGGAVSDVPSDATAYGWRDANFSVVAMGTRSPGLDSWWRRLTPHFEGLYLSFETDVGPEVLARAFPPAHLARLRELKARWDPTGLLRDNFFISRQEHAESA